MVERSLQTRWFNFSVHMTVVDCCQPGIILQPQYNVSLQSPPHSIVTAAERSNLNGYFYII